MIFSDVVFYASGTRYVSTINNSQTSITKWEPGFVGVNKAHLIKCVKCVYKLGEQMQDSLGRRITKYCKRNAYFTKFKIADCQQFGWEQQESQCAMS